MIKVESLDQFNVLVKNCESIKGYKKPIAFGIARVDRGQLNQNKILQASFATVNWKQNDGSAAIFIESLRLSGIKVDFTKSEFVCDVDSSFVKNTLEAFSPFVKEAKEDKHKNVQVITALNEILKEDNLENNYRVVFIFADEPLKSLEAAYLKLYALSCGKVKLRSINLDGAFGVLENVAWSLGVPIELDWLRANEIRLKMEGTYPIIESVDKFPRFLSHIIPADNTRILDSSKVRMGAQLSAGTTVMPGASYVNFNAGTTGSVMVEGRISSSAIVGDGSDVGGGASILGVLSGTDGNPVSIGKNTLLGANSVIGIPLGDGCIVDAGVAILEGTKIAITNIQISKIKELNPNFKYNDSIETHFVKGIELSGFNGIHFRQDSINGTIIALRSKREVVLNSDLH